MERASFSAIDDGLSLFALGSSRDFGNRIAQHLGIALCHHEEREFEDGEHKARPLTNVRGQDVYVVHSLFSDNQQSGNDKLCRLLFFIGTLKDAGAARVTAVVPYLAYARKDRKTKARDPVTTRYVAALFEAVGTDVLLTMDVHNLAAFQNAFRCRTEHLEANRLFIDHFAPALGDKEVVVVSPDAGGAKRAERFRRVLSKTVGKEAGSAFVEKYRSEGVISGGALVGNIEGKDVIILDDMISTGGTILRAAHACCSQSANRVYAVATHGLFSMGASATLADPILDGIVITDTVSSSRTESADIKRKLTVLSSAGMFAEAIRRLHSNESISELVGEDV